jgi:alpha-glucosidase
LENERTLVALNMGGEATSVAFDSGGLAGRLVISSFGDRDGEPINGRIDLRGDEGAVVELFQNSVLPM